MVCNRKVVDPGQFLKEDCGHDADLIDSITRPDSDKTVEEMFQHFEALDSAFSVAASEDDQARRKIVCVSAGCCWLGVDPSGTSYKVASADLDAKVGSGHCVLECDAVPTRHLHFRSDLEQSRLG
jgi:hypothetical protein